MAYLSKAYLYRASWKKYAHKYYGSKYSYSASDWDADYAQAASVGKNAISNAVSNGYYLAPYEEHWTVDNESVSKYMILWSIQFIENTAGFGQGTTMRRGIRDMPTPFRGIKGKGTAGNGWGYALPQRDLWDEYEPDDPRRDYTIWTPGDFYGIYHGEPTAPITTYIYDPVTRAKIETTKSYVDGDSVFYAAAWSPANLNTKKVVTQKEELGYKLFGEDAIFMRLAGLHLIVAEAMAEQGNSEALTYVNNVRSRSDVNLPGRTVGDGRNGDADLVSIVRHERRVEFGMEGMRMLDLMRWGIIKSIYDTKNGGNGGYRNFDWDLLPDGNDAKYDYPTGPPGPGLWPIPQSEIDKNTAMTADDQNPGYN